MEGQPVMGALLRVNSRRLFQCKPAQLSLGATRFGTFIYPIPNGLLLSVAKLANLR